jgi:hypothetical protein
MDSADRNIQADLFDVAASFAMQDIKQTSELPL